jgi:hypothetical protein
VCCQADHSSRGVLPSVMWKPPKRGGLGPIWDVAPQKRTSVTILTHLLYYFVDAFLIRLMESASHMARICGKFKFI